MAVASRHVLVTALTAAAAIGFLQPASGQTVEEPYLAAVMPESVFVRAGADIRYYPFGQVETGDVVRVIGEKSGWARVVTAGPAFVEFFGFVKYLQSESARLEVAADGETAVTLEPIDLFAPNLDAQYDPRSSWKPALTLPEQRTLQVLETVVYEGEIVHRVVLPPDAQGWIELTQLRRATPVEIATWDAATADASPIVQAAAPLTVAAVPVIRIPEPAPGPKANIGASIGPAEPTAPDPTRSSFVAPKVQMPAEAVARKRTAQQRLAQIMFEDLESAYARLLAEPVERAEVEPLRQLYIDLAGRNPASRPITHYASVRARQLELWAEVQQEKIALAELRAKARVTAGLAQSARQVLDAAAEYVAVGRLEASTLYDGERLPKLLRLRDESTGRSLGYLELSETIDLPMLVGKRVGIVGDRTYHGGLRLNVIKPVRIDVLD